MDDDIFEEPVRFFDRFGKSTEKRALGLGQGVANAGMAMPQLLAQPAPPPQGCASQGSSLGLVGLELGPGHQEETSMPWTSEILGYHVSYAYVESEDLPAYSWI